MRRSINVKKIALLIHVLVMSLLISSRGEAGLISFLGGGTLSGSITLNSLDNSVNTYNFSSTFTGFTYTPTSSSLFIIDNVALSTNVAQFSFISNSGEYGLNLDINFGNLGTFPAVVSTIPSGSSIPLCVGTCPLESNALSQASIEQYLLGPNAGSIGLMATPSYVIFNDPVSTYSFTLSSTPSSGTPPSVPEPASFVLLLMGLAGISLARTWRGGSA